MSTLIFDKLYNLNSTADIFREGFLKKTPISPLISAAETLFTYIANPLPLVSSYLATLIRIIGAFLTRLGKGKQILEVKAISFASRVLDSSLRLELLVEIYLDWLSTIFFTCSRSHESLKHQTVEVAWKPFLRFLSFIKSQQNDGYLKQELSWLWLKSESLANIAEEHLTAILETYFIHTFENPYLYIGRRIVAVLYWVKYREQPQGINIWSLNLVDLEDLFSQMKIYEENEDRLILQMDRTIKRKSI